MENQVFWVKYLNYQPVLIKTHFLHGKKLEEPLQYIFELINAFQRTQGSVLANTDPGLINIHLPVEFTRKDLNNPDAFVTEDEDDTALRPDFYLLSLGSIGSEYKKPLLIKVTEGKSLQVSV
jgi:hypothetical protein